MAWNLSCPDWEERLRDGRSLVPSLPLFASEAERALAVYNRLRLPDVLGTPTFGDAGGDWFAEIVSALMGSLDPISGMRMVRELFLLVPKKNSKTTNGAGLMMTAALMSRRPRGEFMIVGPTQAIAETGFNQALGMVLADPQLESRVHIQEHLKRITVKKTGVKLQVKTFDTKIITGAKILGALVDELHILGDYAEASRVIGQIRGGMLPFPEAFLAFITTQSDKPPSGVFRDELNRARGIRDGRLGGDMLPVLYELPAKLQSTDDWRDPVHWGAVNPNLNRSITIDALVKDYEKAVETGEEEIRRWASQHINVEIGLKLRSDRWEGADYWEAAADPTLTLDALLERSEVVVVGIDGGGLDDLLGLSVMGRDRETRNWLAWCHAWAHRDVLKRRKAIAADLLDFEKEGTLTIFDLPGDDVSELVAIVDRINAEGLLPEENAIGVDPVGITEIVDELETIGISPEDSMIVSIRQGWTLSNTIKTTARRLAALTLRHDGSRLMNWCVGNARNEPRGNAVFVTKQASGTAKIDPLMALFDAAALMAKNPAAVHDGTLITMLD